MKQIKITFQTREMYPFKASMIVYENDLQAALNNIRKMNIIEIIQRELDEKKGV